MVENVVTMPLHSTLELESLRTTQGSLRTRKLTRNPTWHAIYDVSWSTRFCVKANLKDMGQTQKPRAYESTNLSNL